MEDSSSKSQRTSHPEIKVLMFHSDANISGNFITLNDEPVGKRCNGLDWNTGSQRRVDFIFIF